MQEEVDMHDATSRMSEISLEFFVKGTQFNLKIKIRPRGRIMGKRSTTSPYRVARRTYLPRIERIPTPLNYPSRRCQRRVKSGYLNLCTGTHKSEKYRPCLGEISCWPEQFKWRGKIKGRKMFTLDCLTARQTVFPTNGIMLGGSPINYVMPNNNIINLQDSGGGWTCCKFDSNVDIVWLITH